jgi:hypothetical protein
VNSKKLQEKRHGSLNLRVNMWQSEFWRRENLSDQNEGLLKLQGKEILKCIYSFFAQQVLCLYKNTINPPSKEDLLFVVGSTLSTLYLDEILSFGSGLSTKSGRYLQIGFV